jgi:signal transduction histidine kinase
MTLLRPVGAWWLSLASVPVVILLTGGGGWPWPAASFTGHLCVMVVVALRTRTRTAVWMWVLTTVGGLFISALGGWYYSNAAAMAVVSGLALTVAVLVQTTSRAREEVVVQQGVTAVERDRRTQLEERTTIARELHDVVAHHMSVVAIQAEAAPYRVENTPPELEQAFITIRENAVAALTELRRILGVVRAEDYEAPDAPQPTLADLDTLLANVRDAGLTVEKTIAGQVRELPPGIELSAYRIIQEALSNVLRHAPGASAQVELVYVLKGLGLRILNGRSDTPTLAKPSASAGAGHGITGMRERVAMLGGEMTNGSKGVEGYQVTVYIPVPEKETDGDTDTNTNIDTDIEAAAGSSDRTGKGRAE